MLSVYQRGTFPPCPAPFNMAEHVLRAGAQQPEKVALSILGDPRASHWRYGELRRAILGTGAGLLAQGLTPGDIVLLRLGNTVDTPIAYLGALAVGLVPAPTSSALTEPETAFIIDQLDPALVLRAPEVACPPFARTMMLDALRALRDHAPAPFQAGDPDRLGYIVFTSGTGGQPRAVGHAHRAIWARQMMFDDWYRLRADDRLLHAGAFNWTYTMGTGLMDPWTKGATALIPAPGTAPQVLPDLLYAHEATIFAAAPGVYRQMLQRAPWSEMPKLRHGLSAGEKLLAATRAGWRAATGREVYEAFGMSECSTFISQAPPSPPPAEALGRPQRGRHIALLQDGTPVARGTEGTIAIHQSDPGLMLGYMIDGQPINDRLCGEWFLTGDQGIMLPEGDILYQGRADDMMNAGGFRVSPVEVEHVLAAHPEIDAVAVTQVEIKPDVDVIAAFYTGPVAIDARALDTYVSERLARYKQPRLYLHRDDLPRGANGKLLRRRLRETFERPQ